MIKVSFLSPSVLAPLLPRLACYLSWVLPRHNREFGLSASPACLCGHRTYPLAEAELGLRLYARQGRPSGRYTGQIAKGR
jgi:hypothetical protein